MAWPREALNPTDNMKLMAMIYPPVVGLNMVNGISQPRHQTVNVRTTTQRIW